MAGELVAQLDEAPPEFTTEVAGSVLGLAIGLDAQVRAAVPSSALLSLGAARLVAGAGTDPATAVPMLANLIDVGARASTALCDGDPEWAADILNGYTAADDLDPH